MRRITNRYLCEYYQRVVPISYYWSIIKHNREKDTNQGTHVVFFFFICNNVDSIQKRQINQDLLFQSVTFTGLAAHQTLLLTVHLTGDSLTSRWNISIPPEVKTCRILTQPSLQLQQVTLMSTAKPPDGIYIYF